jgi:hypothetical protein
MKLKVIPKIRGGANIFLTPIRKRERIKVINTVEDKIKATKFQETFIRIYRPRGRHN